MKKVLRGLSLALVAVCAMVMLASCGVANIEDAEAKLTKEGFKVETMKEGDSGFASEGDEGAEAMLMATKGTGLADMQMVTIVYFKDKDSAKKAYDTAMKELPAAQKDLMEIKLSGKVIVMGTKDAVKLVA